MKTSTNRDSKVKHSTGSNGTMTRKKNHRRPRPKTSTGEKATITHFTGRSLDVQPKEEAQEKKPAKHKAA